MAGIFISYRREDAGGHAGRLCDRLNARLGHDRVFMDVEDVRPGEDFVRAIDDRVRSCDYLLVVIGPRWLESMERRGASDTDFVRHEILTALRSATVVVPVLVAGARMPRAPELPPDLAELSRRNAVEIRDDRFDDDVGRLAGFLGGAASASRGGAMDSSRARRWVLAAVIVVVAGAAAAWFFAARPGTPAIVADAPPGVPAPVEPVNIAGEYIADMQTPGRPGFRIRLTLTQSGRTIGGVVRYPTGDGVIQEGTLDGEALTFSTSHVPQFESEPAILRFIGTVEPGGIRLDLADVSGVASGVARRVTP